MSEPEMTLSEAACIVLTMAERYISRTEEDDQDDQVEACELLERYLENEGIAVGSVGVTREDLR
jgi:hypothetical protein